MGKKKKKKKSRRSARGARGSVANRSRKESGFKKNYSVVANEGVTESLYNTDIGGWQGRIRTMRKTDEAGLEFEIDWDSITLKEMPRGFIQKCAEDGNPWASATLSSEDVAPAEPRDRKRAVGRVVEKIEGELNVADDRDWDDDEDQYNDDLVDAGDYTTKGIEVFSVQRAEKGSEIPTRDLLESYDVENKEQIDLALDYFLMVIRRGELKLWDVVERRERGELAPDEEKKIVAQLDSFGDPESQEIITHINGEPRPSEPWWEPVRKIGEALVQEKYKTYESDSMAYIRGARRLLEDVEKLGADLSLPEGVETAVEVLPQDALCRLRLQACFEEIVGLGEALTQTLEDPEDGDDLAFFVENLRNIKPCVAYLDVTIETMLKIIVFLPPARKALTRKMLELLEMPSADEKLADYL